MAGHALIDVMAELSLCIQYEVLGCFRERTYMLTMNPHITNWVPIAVPQPGEKWVSDGSTYPLRDAVENLEALLAVVMLTPRSSLQLVLLHLQSGKGIEGWLMPEHARGRREMHNCCTKSSACFSGVFAPKPL